MRHSTTEHEIRTHMKIAPTAENMVQWIMLKLDEAFIEGVNYMADRAKDLVTENEVKQIEKHIQTMGQVFESKLN